MARSVSLQRQTTRNLHHSSPGNAIEPWNLAFSALNYCPNIDRKVSSASDAAGICHSRHIYFKREALVSPGAGGPPGPILIYLAGTETDLAF
jgi:hypothetical protein